MIPVIQTKVVIRNSANKMVVFGNCWAAAIASILEVPITEVPNFETWFHFKNLYNDLTEVWLNSKGWTLDTDDRFKCFHYELCQNWPPERVVVYRELLKDLYYLVSGKSPRGINHVTIWRNGIMVHDPHPSGDGILELTYFEHIRPMTDQEKENLENYPVRNIAFTLTPLADDL